MQQQIIIFLTVLFSILGLSSFRNLNDDKNPKNGDLVFIVNPSGQGKAIQLATKSKFTHVGIVFIENGKPVVYHAVEPVSKNSLEEFRAMSVDGKVEIKRLKD